MLSDYQECKDCGDILKISEFHECPKNIDVTSGNIVFNNDQSILSNDNVLNYQINPALIYDNIGSLSLNTLSNPIFVDKVIQKLEKQNSDSYDQITKLEYKNSKIIKSKKILLKKIKKLYNNCLNNNSINFEKHQKSKLIGIIDSILNDMLIEIDQLFKEEK